MTSDMKTIEFKNNILGFCYNKKAMQKLGCKITEKILLDKIR